MTDPITLPQIAVMDTVIPDLRLLHLAHEAADRQCCEFGKLASDAWKLFDVAVDEEQPTEVRNELAAVAFEAEKRLSQAKAERDQIEAQLLAVQS